MYNGRRLRAYSNSRADSGYSSYRAANITNRNKSCSTMQGEHADYQHKLPKNFEKPLTCFYWHTYGHCTKSDESCLYAHYPTGVVAAAPVSLDGGKGPVAGRNAILQLNDQAARERQLQEWEALLSAREMEMNGRSTTIDSTSRMKASNANFYEVIANGETSINKARDALVVSRELLSDLQISKGEDACNPAAHVVGQAIVAIDALKSDLDDLHKKLEDGGSKSSSSLEHAQAFL